MVRRIIYWFYNAIIQPFLKAIVGVKFINQEALANEEQCIIVANHNSHLDALSILSALPPRQFANTYTVAASDYFTKSVGLKSLVKLFFNPVFIERNRNNEKPCPLKKMDDLLKKGKSLILFPEGTRGEAGVMNEFKKGVAVLLKRNPNVKFLPTYIDGFDKALPKDANFLLPIVSKVRFGYPKNIRSADNVDMILSKIKQSIYDLKSLTLNQK